MRTIDESKDHFEWVVKQAGCSVEETSLIQKVHCLRTKDVATLIKASESAQLHDWSWQFRPVVDNHLFKDYPTSLLNAGKVSAVPLLVGATSNETFVPEGKLEPDLRRWYPHLTDEEMGQIARIYDSPHFATELEKAKIAVGETLNRCGRDLLAFTLSKARVPVYAYRFDERDPTQPPEDGVQHSAENYFMFRGVSTGSNGTFSFAPPEAVPVGFSQELISRWTSFARSGDPNSYRIDKAPHWPQWETRRLWGLWKTGPWRMVLKQPDSWNAV
ncbi:hypothetical protein PIIN_11489 [Serendipita indica DSM 11827]|uniref:Carboxylesterase type B domain-containing protein n=1 Tax=Serendipita indica (strain DSM 11827) TaxID=1109443 RepID=G4U1R9_SERID|nr:hypothetical protein PIIN_11489 [Serendipita indica DSM 11827]